MLASGPLQRILLTRPPLLFSLFRPLRFSAVFSSSMATVATSDWRRVHPAANGVPPFSVYEKEIQKSEQDDRDYMLIRLDNGLEATVIHDVKADKAAASLDVAVGHLSDPDDMPGLAHFCEHLLFMGTEKFPKENEYSEYLAKNNGSSNAYTSSSNTNYYFHVATSALPGALERFSGFFHSPLFAPSCTSRELNAVDSEHKKNHQSDMWRIFQLNKHLSKPGHAWRKFGSGNRDSLLKAARELKANGQLTDAGITSTRTGALSPISSRGASPAPSIASNGSDTDADGGVVGRETRRRLVEWWSKEYCASRMRLCVIGKESLDELSELISTLFSPIPNRGCDPLPMITDHPFGIDEKGTLVSVQTIMSFHALEISFPLEYQVPHWKHKPAHFITHLVGHEGPGSLYSYLKDKGWVTSLGAGPQAIARGFAMFRITIHLTEEGYRNYRSVVLACFKYLTLLRSSQFPPYHQREIATISATRFRFAEKRRADDYATWISEHMSWRLPGESILSGPQITHEWDDYATGEGKVREYLSNFRVTEGRIVLMARGSEHEKLFPNATWQKEPWYGTEYNIQHFGETFIKEAESANDIPDLFLPHPNEFIPTNFDTGKRDVPEVAKRPHLLRETPLSTLWHKKDDRFWVPKAHIVVDLRSVIGSGSARASVMTRLYVDLVNDSLSEFSYDADLAGLSYNFLQHQSGLFISMNGYNDKMSALTRHVFEKIRTLAVNPTRLAVMKEQAKREWENFFLGQSYSLSDFYARYLMSETWTVEEKLKELSSITADEIQIHIKKLLSEVNLRILIAGNVYKDEALKIAEMVEEGLGPSPHSPIDLNDGCLVLPPDSNHTWSMLLPNPNQANSALTFYVRYGPVADQRLRVTSALLTQILSEPAFNVLRTREQLGYVVSCTSWSLPGGTEKGMRIVIQSERNPSYLEDRVEAFLDGMKNHLETMSEEEFLDQKSGLERRWLEADKNLADETTRFMAHISTNDLDFLRRETDARVLRSVTKGDTLALFLSHVHQSSPTRRKLSVHMRSQKPRPKRVSSLAAQEFESLLRAQHLDVDENTWTESLGDEAPLLTDFNNYWKQILLAKPEGQQLLDALPDLVEKYPVEGDGPEIPRQNITYIDDPKKFKASLARVHGPGPMVQWGDLPISKF